MHWGSFHIRVDYFSAKWQMSKMCLPKKEAEWRKSNRIMSSSRRVRVSKCFHFNSSSVRKESRRRWEKCKSRNPVYIIFPFLFTVALLHKKKQQPPLIPFASSTHPNHYRNIFSSLFIFSFLFFVGWFLSFFFLIFISLHIFPFNFYLLRLFCCVLDNGSFFLVTLT